MFSLARVCSPAALGAGVALIGSSARCDADVPKAKAAIEAFMDKSAESRGDGSSMGPTLVRLAWHASGTFCQKTGTGGSAGGRMKFEPECAWGANAGLAEARAAMEEIAACAEISRADAYTLGGVVAIEAMGGPAVPWRVGRSDARDGTSSPPDGRLPNADMGQIKATIAHIREIFYRMGLTDQEIVALSGAHAIGRCHTDASGYWGPWTYAETTFSNEYFRLLLEETWTLKTSHQGAPWTGPDQFETPDGKLMMLPSDMALIWDKEFRQHVQVYAKDEDKFFADFSSAFAKMLEFGCKFPEANLGFFGRIKLFLGL